MPVPAPVSVAFVIFPGMQILDFAGPVSVFNAANRIAEQEYYVPKILATEAGCVRTSLGVGLQPDGLFGDFNEDVHTLVIPGGFGVSAVLARRRLVPWLQRMAPRVQRLVSVCGGALILAEAGLLNGKCATTHWGSCRKLAERYPLVEVDSNAIFVRNGSTWTSAGVTAGMDLALALVEEDLGKKVALAVARQLVMFVRRPGGQSQFSTQLAAQSVEHEPVRRLQEWIIDNLATDLSVAALAERAGMSQRNFARVFTREVGNTPGDFVEAARLEKARQLLVDDLTMPVDEVSRACGFGTQEQMRRAFHRKLGINARDYRERFRARETGDIVARSVTGREENRI